MGTKPLTVEGAMEETAQNNCLCNNTWHDNKNMSSYDNP